MPFCRFSIRLVMPMICSGRSTILRLCGPVIGVFGGLAMASKLCKLLLSRRLVLILPLIVAACSEPEQQVEQPLVRPVKTVVVGDDETGGIRSFPARIESSRRADLSFRVSGTLVDIGVREGERIEEGQTIAQLDTANYQLVVDDRAATRERIAKDFSRAEELLPNGFIPRRTYDRLEADLRNATAALQQARLDLGYTTLTAPFAGEIARRLTENFEEVQAKQTIVELRDISALEVKFDVPEQIMIQMQAARSEDERLPPPEVFASFDSAPERFFPLDFKEVAVSADRATQTFEATFTMSAPDGLLVLPGMTANTTVDLSAYLGQTNLTYIPVEAVVASNDLAPRVWIVDEATMTVNARAVEVGQLIGSQIAIASGLEPGDRVVIAGAPFLTPGQLVSILPDVEQAAERADDQNLRLQSRQSAAKKGN